MLKRVAWKPVAGRATPMAKTAEERIESLEKKVAVYRIASVLLVLFILAIQRERVVKWLDGMEGWFTQATNIR